MLQHAPSRTPGPFRFKPHLPTKPPLLTSTSSRGSLCTAAAATRRNLLVLAPSLVAASTVLQSLPFAASAGVDDSPAPQPAAPAAPAAEAEPAALPRVYDATVIGEPMAVGKEGRRRVWEKLMVARVVYLGEAELVPDRDDRVLELEIVKKLAAACADTGRSISLALEAFPCDLQEQLNRFMDGRIDDNKLKLYTSHWAPERWQEYEPLLNYCRDNGVKLVACGTPLEDLQKGLDLGVVSPEILQNFFDLEKYPFMAELLHRFQGFRERLLADPKFLNRLAIEEGISITTTLIAQYEKRKGRFFEEIDYVLTDTIRGSVVDFFTVWLPAPTISLLSVGDDGSGESLELLKGLLGSLPDNAFQKGIVGQNWNINQRFAAVLMGGIKLAGVGFVSSIGAGVASDVLYGARRFLKPSGSVEVGRKRSPIWKSAAVYSCFLGTSANLRYQVIAGLIEHRLGEDLMAYYNQPLLANLLSFVSRIINSYWGTQQWIDIARFTGVQNSKKQLPSPEVSNPAEMPLLECGTTDVQNVDDSQNQSNDLT